MKTIDWMEQTEQNEITTDCKKSRDVVKYPEIPLREGSLPGRELSVPAK